MTNVSEEAVVSKTARLVGEVGLRKGVTDSVETVRDTLRKDDVEIEQVPGDALVTSTSTTTGTMGTTGTTPPPHASLASVAALAGMAARRAATSVAQTSPAHAVAVAALG